MRSVLNAMEHENADTDIRQDPLSAMFYLGGYVERAEIAFEEIGDILNEQFPDWAKEYNNNNENR